MCVQSHPEILSFYQQQSQLKAAKLRGEKKRTILDLTGPQASDTLATSARKSLRKELRWIRATMVPPAKQCSPLKMLSLGYILFICVKPRLWFT